MTETNNEKEMQQIIKQLDVLSISSDSDNRIFKSNKL